MENWVLLLVQELVQEVRERPVLVSREVVVLRSVALEEPVPGRPAVRPSNPEQAECFAYRRSHNFIYLGREDEVIFRKAFDGMRGEFHADPSPPYGEVGMVPFFFRDRGYLICKTHGLKKVLELEFF